MKLETTRQVAQGEKITQLRIIMIRTICSDFRTLEGSYLRNQKWNLVVIQNSLKIYEPRTNQNSLLVKRQTDNTTRETSLQGFQPGSTQIGLLLHS